MNAKEGTNRAFIFDMDGVLVDSEKQWEIVAPTSLVDLFGKHIADKIGDTVGGSVSQIYETAVANGANITKEAYMQWYTEIAYRVYDACTVSQDAELVVQHLVTDNWKIGILSSSPQLWIDYVVKRLPWRDSLSMVISLHDHPELKSKPAPDGYQFIVQAFGATPATSIALEDSNPGIQSAKSAGLFTIGYKEHLPQGYKQQGADMYVHGMRHILAFLQKDAAK